MKKDCIQGNESYEGYENGEKIAYLKLFFNPLKCSRCNWKDGWSAEYQKGRHPCRLILVNHPNYFDSAIEYLDYLQVWTVTFRFTMSELDEFVKTLPLLVEDERMMLTSG